MPHDHLTQLSWKEPLDNLFSCKIVKLKAIQGSMMKLLSGVRVGIVVIAAAIITTVFGVPNICASKNKDVTLELTYPAGESPKVFTNTRTTM